MHETVFILTSYSLQNGRSEDPFPVGAEAFRTCTVQPAVGPIQLYSGYQVCFPVVKGPGRGHDHPHPHLRGRLNKRILLLVFRSPQCKPTNANSSSESQQYFNMPAATRFEPHWPIIRECILAQNNSLSFLSPPVRNDEHIQTSCSNECAQIHLLQNIHWRIRDSSTTYWR